MKHTRKTGRGLSLPLTLAMVLTLLPTAALAADTGPTNLTLYFGESSSSGSWGLFTDRSLTTGYETKVHSGRYVIDGNTLSLIDFSLSTSAPEALVMSEGSILEVIGTNSITSTYSGDVAPMISALSSKGALTINGSGTLTLQSGTSTFTGGYSMGLHATDDLTIEGATVKATSGSAPKDRGVFVGGDSLSLSNSACLTGLSDPGTSQGVGVEVIGGITLNNSELTARGSLQAVKPVSLINKLDPESVILSASASYDGSAATSEGIQWVTDRESTYKVGGATAKYLNATTPTPTPSVADYTLFFSGGKLRQGSADGTIYTGENTTWSGNENTLTLKDGFTFSTTAATALTVAADTTIVLNGSSSITTQNDDAPGTTRVGIDAEACSLIISSTTGGSLTVTAGATTGGSSGLHGSYGVKAKNITVDGAILTANSKTSNKMSYGMDIASGTVGLTLKNQATVTAAASESHPAVGLFVEQGQVIFEGDGNTLIAKGGTFALQATVAQENLATEEASLNYSGEPLADSFTYDPESKRYLIGDDQAHYVRLVSGTPSGPTDYTLVYNSTDSKFHKNTSEGTVVDTPAGCTPSGSTLTMNGFAFSTSAAKALELPAGVTLTLQGDNTITSTYSGASASPVAAIVANGALTINGGGKLTAQAGANSSNQFAGQTASVGLYSTAEPTEENDVNISGGTTVIVKGGTVHESGRSAGIDIRDHLTIDGTSRFTAESDPAAAIGIGAKCGGITVLNGGKLVAKGTTYAVGLTVEDNIIVNGAQTHVSTRYDGTGCELIGDPLSSTGKAGSLTYYKASGEAAKYLQVGGEAPAATPDYTLYYNATDGKLHKNAVGGPEVEGLTGTMGHESTLTLTDFNFTTSAKTALVMPANSGLVLAGTSSITSTYDGASPTEPVAAVIGEGVLNISGSGTLNIQGGKNQSGQASGLKTEGNLTITTAIVSATAGAGTADCDGVRIGDIIGGETGTLLLQNGAKLTAVSPADQANGYGVVVGNVIRIDNGELIAQGIDQALYSTNEITPAGAVITASVQHDGTGAATGAVWDDTDFFTYMIGDVPAQYVKATNGGSTPPPTPITADYTLYYNATNGKLYKDQAYTTEATGLTGAAGAASTLTLNGFNFSTTAKTALVMPAGSTLALVGDNTITSTFSDSVSNEVAAVSCAGALTISGAGKLTIQGGGNTSSGGSAMSMGLITAGGLTVNGATVVVTAGSCDKSLGIGVTSGNLLLQNNAKVTGASYSTSSMGFGIMLMGSITVNGELIAQGSLGALSSASAIAPANATITASIQYDGTGAKAGATATEEENMGTIYMLPGEGAAKYLKAVVDGSKGTITVGTQPENQTVTYGQINAVLTAAATASNGKTVSYQWCEAKGLDKADPTIISGATKASYTIPTGSNAGSYYYFCKLTADDCDPVESDVATVTVNKATYTGLKTGSAFVKASEETNGKNYYLPVLPTGASYSVGAVTTSGALIKANPTVTPSGGRMALTYSTTSQDVDATGTITVPVTGALNYNNYDFVLTVTATGKTEAAVKGLTAAAGLVYDGAARQGYTGTPAFDPAVTADPSILVYSYESVDGASYGPSEVAPTNAGDYKLTVSFPAENETYVGSVDLNFTIARKPVTLSLEDRTITAGDPIPTSFSAKFTGVVEGETLTLGDHTPSITGRPANSDTPGTHTITWTNMNSAVPEASVGTTLNNYIITTLGSCTLTINPKSSSSSGSSSSSTVTVPVTGLDGAKVKANVSGGKATISSIDTSKLDEDSGVVSIDLTGLKKDVDEAGLPTKSVDEIAESGAEGLELKLSNGTVEFDNAALRSIADQAKGRQINLVVDPDVPARKTLTPAQQETVDKLGKTRLVEVYLTSDNQRISNFDGGIATVRIPLPSDWDAEKTAVVFVDDQGNAEIMETRVEIIDGKPFMVFETTHFSHYLITTDADTLPGQWVNPFTDVEEDDWFYGAVKFMNQQGLMSGTSDTTFSPGTATTRGMIVTILYRMEGEPSITEEGTAFTDVSDGQYYSQAVAWGSANGIVKGYDDGRFGPDDLITREQLAAILYRYAQYKGQNPAASGDLSGFGDQPSAWALDAVKWAVGEGFVTGKGEGILDPLGKATRAEAATMLQRFLEAK